MSAATVAGALVTPTGVLVTDAAPETPDWFAARAAGITGTDLPKILGLSKYGNALSVWLDKRGEAPADEVGEAATWGHILEDPVAQEWAQRNAAVVERVGVLAHAEHGHRRASLDRLVAPGTCPDGRDSVLLTALGGCGLEVKTRNAFVAGRWSDDIPDDVLAQVQWGLHVTGLHHMHVAVLIGGQELRQFRVDRDAALEAYLIEEADRVWQAYTDGIPPVAAPDRDGVLLDLLNRMYEAREGDRDLDPAEARKWLDQYAEGSVLVKEGDALKTEAKTALVQLIDDGDRGLVDGQQAFTYRRPQPSTGMPAAAVKRLAKDQPDTYAALVEDGFITTTQGGPRFNVTAAKGD